MIQSGTAARPGAGSRSLLANGDVLTSLRKMVKNNTGYDLKHWFIGSEGTLGVITRAVLRLHPQRAARHTALVALDGYDAAVNLLRRLSTRFGNDIGAFEIMWPDFYDFGVKLTGARSPFDGSHPLYALIEHASFDSSDDGERFAAGAYRRARRRRDPRCGDRAVRGRRACAMGDPRMHGRISCAARCDQLRCEPADQRDRRLCRALPRGARTNGGPETNRIFRPYRRFEPARHRGRPFDSRASIITRVYAFVYEMLGPLHGSVSAEHGIGLAQARVPADLALARRTRGDAAIKHALDPHGILNPGKLF